MSQQPSFDDLTRCPSCGEPNECAVAAGRSAELCWCMSVTIDPETIARIPAEARGKVCICRRCASRSDDAG